MERTPGASSSLCVHTKNQQISVRGKQYANRLWMVLRRFAVPSIHTRIWFANRLRAVRKPFSVLVYTRLIIPATHLQKTGISVPPYVFILKGWWGEVNIQ